MPLPFILGGAALLAGAAGLGGMLSAKETMEKAERIGNRSKDNYEDAKSSFEEKLQVVNLHVENLGKKKLELQAGTFARFIHVYEKVGKLVNTECPDAQFEIEMKSKDLKQFREQSIRASEMMNGGIGALSSGVLTAMGIYNGVTTFGVASTGTAIGTLSGAAATNATLAALGGGSLAAGGFGIAGGTAVLGGLVAGPALLVTGFLLDSKAEKALTQAREFEAEVDIEVEKFSARKVVLTGLRKRSEEVELVLDRLEEKIVPLLDWLEDESHFYSGRDFFIEELYRAAMIAKSMKEIVNTPLLDGKGNLTEESATVLEAGSII